MNKFIDILHSQPRTIITLLLALIIGGIYSYISIPKESNPDIDIPVFEKWVDFESVLKEAY